MGYLKNNLIGGELLTHLNRHAGKTTINHFWMRIREGEKIDLDELLNTSEISSDEKYDFIVNSKMLSNSDLEGNFRARIAKYPQDINTLRNLGDLLESEGINKD